MKKTLKILVIILVIALVYLRVSVYPQLDLISGFSAKSVASAHFIDHRSLETIQIGDNDIPKVDWANNQINDFEIQLVKKNGEVSDTSVNAALLLDNNGKPIGIEGVIRDISVRKNYQRNEHLFPE